MNDVRDLSLKIKNNINKVIIGKDEAIDLIIVSILCSGHVLLQDVPGLGKTVLARSLAKTIDSSFNRIQFTPDLLPSDLTGINFYNQKSGDFQFKKGPIMNQIVLADEINRATPRTQSSLLEAMEEHQVTVDGNTYKLNEPFFVIATQNPIETGGTFPLPEAQLDRFLMQLSLGYPDIEEEMKILKRFMSNNPLEEISSVINSDEILKGREKVNDVYISDEIIEYILKIVKKTRGHESIELGISPRGSISLLKACRAYAAINGRDYVLPDDVKLLVKPVFVHRIILKNPTYLTGKSSQDILEEILKNISTPVEKVI